MRSFSLLSVRANRITVKGFGSRCRQKGYWRWPLCELIQITSLNFGQEHPTCDLLESRSDQVLLGM
jgi:hypothetical protein